MSTEATTLPPPGPAVAPVQTGVAGAGADTAQSRATPDERRWSLAGAALIAMLVMSAALVVVVASHPSSLSPPSLRTNFPDWMRGPIALLTPDIWLSHDAREWGFTTIMALLYVCYVVVLRGATRIRARPAIAAIVALHVIFALAPPLALTDIFNYVNYGRMGFVHHLNPYTTIPALEPHSDPSFVLSDWHHLLSPYGPLFTLFTYAMAAAGLMAGVWILKLSLLLASLSVLWLVWQSAKLLGQDPLRAVLFVGLNPLVLIWGLGGDHNDFFMMALIMAGVYGLLRVRDQLERRADAAHDDGEEGKGDRSGWRQALPGGWRQALPGLDVAAGFSLAAAAAVKASAVVLLPVILCGAPRRLRLLAGMVLAGLVLGSASLVAFGPHLPGLADQSSLVTSLSLPNLVGYTLGLGGETGVERDVVNVALLTMLIGCCVWAWRSREWVAPAAVAMAAFVLTLSWQLPWYVYWLLPLAALAQRRWLRWTALALGGLLLVAWVPMLTSLVTGLNVDPSVTPLGELHAHVSKRLLH